MLLRSRKTLLVIDDEKTFCVAVKDYVEDEQLEVVSAHSGAEGLSLFGKRSVDIVLLDQRLPDGDGHSLVPELLKRNEQLKIIFITAYPTFENAVAAVRSGAHDYLSKPVDMEELRITVRKALRTLDLEKVEQIHTIEQERERNQSVIIGKDGGLAEVAQLIESARKTDAPVLITGETGTGKNLVAKAIHYRGALGSAPFISVNCAALPEHLIEAELFGHEKGSFTGAIAAKKGMFELADGGTLFLDEIGDMPLHLQAKLLSAIEEGEVRRIGGAMPKAVKVRVIAATNAELEQSLGKSFRKDLYFRLSVITIHIPPLRERRKDIPSLCEYLLKNIAPGRCIALSEDETTKMMQYDWPGNVRELGNVLERAALVMRDEEFRPSTLLQFTANRQAQPSASGGEDRAAEGFTTIQTAERQLISETFKKLDGNIARTAQTLGMSLSTLKRRIKEYGLK
ncbi:MAG: sigma-54 dependent transcriptional regulator [Nitrospiraceae bacterium]|nr:sigma-54 dependent transcriptional regulator [Nitrospiraceae bacterium]